MESNGVSAHGTLVFRNGTLIPELRDVAPPELSRETHEVTKHGDDDDVYKIGIRSYSLLYFTLNLLFDEPEHVGLLDAWTDYQEDSWEVHFADGALWAFDGFVCEFGPANPVDGVQSVRVGVCISGDVSFTPLLLQEDGDLLLLENGDGIAV